MNKVQETVVEEVATPSAGRKWVWVVLGLLAAGVAAGVVLLRDSPAPAPPPAAVEGGLWLSAAQLQALPTSGEAWLRLQFMAELSFDKAELTERNAHNIQVLAAALVAARLDDDGYRQKVRDELEALVGTPINDNDVLAACRRLGTYAIAADLINLNSFDPGFAGDFARWLDEMLHVEYRGGGGGGSIVTVHERRLNNFGTQAGASRIAVAAYLGDTEQLESAAMVFRGWLGDRDAYDDFTPGAGDWQADPSKPVGINPAGATLVIEGDVRDVDGVLPDDQRRSRLRWPPPKEGYVWGAMGGAVVSAELLHLQGYDAWEWEDQALRRAARWLFDVADFPARNEDAWQTWLLNAAYGSDFETKEPSATMPGVNMEFTDWTHATTG